MADDLPYRAEYAKTGRASCRGCKSPIQKDVLRLAVLVQSPMFDGKMTHWFHFDCFFGKQRPKTVGDIAHFDSLRWEDQEKIRKRIEALSKGVAPIVTSASSSKGKKRTANAPDALKDFTIEYAKSGRAVCRGCEEKILKDEVRISKKDFESDVGKRYGGQDLWHHLDCFVKLRDELQFWASGADLPGIKTLTKEDQILVKEKLPKIDVKIKDEVDGAGPAKKVKAEPVDKSESEEMKKQNKIMFKYRDQLKAQLKKKEMAMLLEYNGQQVPPGEEKILDRLSDVMTFGKLLPCPECKGGQFVFRTGVGYQCMGDLTEWTKCQNKTLDPPRAPFEVPKEMREKFDFLNAYKYKERKRLIRLTPPSSIPDSVLSQLPSMPVKSEPGVEEKSQPKVFRPPPPLKNIEIVIIGKTERGKDSLKKQIAQLGGKVSTRLHPMVFAVISSQDEIERMGARMTEVKDLDIHVVTEDFVDEVKDGTSPLVAIKSKAISPWGGNPKARIPEVSEAQKSRLKSNKSMYKSQASKVTVKVKGGVGVDPDSGLEDIAYVYRDGKTVYNAVLGMTDIQSGRNSYYKLQLLQADKGHKLWLFRSWGRIGTTIGGNKVEEIGSLHEGKEAFKNLFQEKTGNAWEDREHFVKRPGLMYPLDVSYGNENESKKLAEAAGDVESKLDKPVQELIATIFDVETMKRCLMEFELDLEKMPLGKLSQQQLIRAYSVLKELMDLIQKDAKDDVKSVNSHARYVDASNRFYTLVPHDFGTDIPPVLNSEEIIKQKMEMLDSLMEIEIAYSMLDSNASGDDVHPIDAQYAKLKADIEVLSPDMEEFEILQKYVKNTHGPTHTQFELEIDQVFKVRRHGEDRKFKPFKKLPNRKLLWHGSRLTNYAGILSQGLRIAPPEAPVTGYMFGKGIYFADMVSKSANYCMTSKKNPMGYMLLCEVALGNMYERTRAEYIEKPPKGHHSVKGVGKTEPHPEAVVTLHDGIEVPIGTPVTKEDIETSLLYNEYIVYDTAQVKFQYLLKMKFNHKF